MNNDFHLDITKTQLEICIAFCHVQGQLEGKWFTLSDISRISHTDYVGTIYREKLFLENHRITIRRDDELYRVDFDNIAYLLGTLKNTRVLVDLFGQYIILPKKMV